MIAGRPLGSVGFSINKDWLYQRYIIEKLTTVKIGLLCGCSNQTIGRRLKEFNIQRRTGGYTTGHKHTEETKQKLRLIHKNRIFSEEWKAKLKKAKKGKHRGENNPNWRGGISPENHLVRTSKEYKEWRKGVFERDNCTCVRCLKYGNGNLNAHHVIPFSIAPEERFELSNGATLCEECHKYIHTIELRGDSND